MNGAMAISPKEAEIHTLAVFPTLLAKANSLVTILAPIRGPVREGTQATTLATTQALNAFPARATARAIDLTQATAQAQGQGTTKAIMATTRMPLPRVANHRGALILIHPTLGPLPPWMKDSLSNQNGKVTEAIWMTLSANLRP